MLARAAGRAAQVKSSRERWDVYKRRMEWGDGMYSPMVQSVRIFGFHPDGPGSIPGWGAIFEPRLLLEALIGEERGKCIINNYAINSNIRYNCGSVQQQPPPSLFFYFSFLSSMAFASVLREIVMFELGSNPSMPSARIAPLPPRTRFPVPPCAFYFAYIAAKVSQSQTYSLPASGTPKSRSARSWRW